jgi:AraC-like DNA-binding protein
VRLFWARQASAAIPFLYDSGIVLVFQGRKIGYLADGEFTYDADNYLVLGMPLPFDCATYASPEEPLAGLYVDVERRELRELVSLLEAFDAKYKTADEKTAASVEPAGFTEGMRSAADRLFLMLDDPLKCAVMGTAARREVLFQALRGPRANTLISLIRYASTDERIEAGMSVSAFHRAFKQKTGHSPIQYLKLIRLHYARRLLAFETHKIGEIARIVGYESVSQFGREYRRLFNEPPSAVRDNTTRLPLSVSDSMNFNFPTKS